MQLPQLYSLRTSDFILQPGPRDLQLSQRRNHKTDIWSSLQKIGPIGSPVNQ